MTAFGVSGAPPLVRAMNLLLDRPARDIAVVAPAKSGRMLTVVPWRGYSLVGTFQSSTPVTESSVTPPDAAIDEMLAEVNAIFPALHADRRGIRTLHHGLTPAVVKGARAELQSDPAVIDHHRHGAPGLVSVVGVKLTTARHAAELAVDAICRELGGVRKRCRTAAVPLPHAGIADVEGRLTEALRAVGAELDRDTIEHLTGWYGTEAPAVVEFSARHNLLNRLTPDSPVIAGEIAYAVERSSAAKLADAVLRRTPLGSAGHPGRAALERGGDVMGDILGWTPERRSKEIAAVELRYPRSPERAAEDATAR
jgi:glycerol-3-phosphate dehydrogenase